MANAESSAHAAVRNWSLVLYHFLVIRISSLVIRVLTLAIRAYQITISPALAFLFGPTAGCRFTPTCSQFAVDAIRSRGAFAGSWLAAKRICRCHPLGGCGHDPVAKAENKLVLGDSL